MLFSEPIHDFLSVLLCASKEVFRAPDIERPVGLTGEDIDVIVH